MSNYYSNLTKSSFTYKEIFTTFLVYALLISFMLYVYYEQYNYNFIMFILLITIAVFPLFLFRDLFHPFNIFLISTQFFYIFNMIDIHYNKSSFRYGTLDPALHETYFSWSILIVIIWYIFMYAGYAFATRTKTELIKKEKFFKVDNTKAIGVILIFIGLLSYALIFFLQGGLQGVISGLNNRVEAYAGMGYFKLLTTLITVGSLFLLSTGKKKLSFFFILITFIFLVSYGGRSTAFFSSVFPYLVFYHYKYKNLRFVTLLPLAFVMMIFAIALGNYRLYNEFQLDFSNVYEILSKVGMSIQGGEILPSLVGSLMEGKIDYQYGAILMNILYAPIPSSIWQNKPPIDESGVVGRALMGSEYWGLPPGPYGLAFYNFGFIGVILIAFVTGYLINKFYYKMVVNKFSDSALIFYIMIIVSAFNFLATSDQIEILWYFITFIAIYFINKFLNIIKNKGMQNENNSKIY
ncbi:O-antigen polymerase [Salinicoccus hispanicus]|uniref:O-antigen polysaccharide polymerase Wzy n=1 Tax=Salinicoccus hispanicus TaxID=157225 RepID=A0A6N8TZR8_9STAP|nr:O-antigen polymerase [Salinicoccus hispanicus]MXQ50972.1 O-antigen polysaccharide polymerase Wzy [Salinicoccus hispanicus]